jgi:adenylate cyclase
MSCAMEPSDSWRFLADALLGKAELTALDVARQSGVEPDDARRLWQALGFPPVTDDERHFTPADVEVLRAVRALVEVQHVDPSDLLQVTRVVGQSLARVADAQVTVVAERLAVGQHGNDTGQDDAAPGPYDAAPAERQSPAELVARIQGLAPNLEQCFGYVWRRHLLAALLRLSATPSAADRVLSVGFVDVVEFTAMSETLDPRELAAIVDRFEAVAYKQVLERGGRVVKMIGDEVMFCVDDGARAAEIALALVEAHARDAGLPDVRVGVASGPALAWEGDLFGPTVNLASRLVNFARPGTVLVADELGEQLQDQPGLALLHLRAVRLKGIGRVRTWVLRRAESHEIGSTR